MEDFLPIGLPIVPIVKAVGITSSLILAGSTATTTLFLPSILHSPSPSETRSARARRLALAWRQLHRTAFYVSIPPCLVGSMAWTFCLLTTPPDALALRVLYGTAALGVGGVLGYSVTIMRPCIGALYARAEEAEGQAADLEKGGYHDVDEIERLIATWGRHNLIRAGLVGVGAVAGTWAALNECFLGGVQVGADWVLRQVIEAQSRRRGVEEVAAR